MTKTNQVEFNILQSDQWSPHFETPATLKNKNYVSNLEWKYRQGIEEGIEEGREKGINETTINFIHKLYAKGIKIEEIAEITDFSIEEVQKHIKS